VDVGEICRYLLARVKKKRGGGVRITILEAPYKKYII
jgi:hypothetical protein